MNIQFIEIERRGYAHPRLLEPRGAEMRQVHEQGGSLLFLLDVRGLPRRGDGKTSPHEELGGKMFLLKGCPKCKGDLVFDKDSNGIFVKCLQCGFLRDLDRISNLQSVPDLPVKENPRAKHAKKGGNALKLTRREEELAELIAQGLTTEEIAYELCISVYSVKYTLRSVLYKMSARNRAHLACKWREKHPRQPAKVS